MGLGRKKEKPPEPPVPLAIPLTVCEPDPRIPDQLAAIQHRMTRMGDHLHDVNQSLVQGIEREIDVHDKLAEVRSGQDAICVMLGDLAKLILEEVNKPRPVSIRLAPGLKLVRVRP